MSAGLAVISPQRTATVSARLRMAWILRTNEADSEVERSRQNVEMCWGRKRSIRWRPSAGLIWRLTCDS